MKKKFTTGSVALFIALSFAACTKNDSSNPTPKKNGIVFTPPKKDTVTPPNKLITIKDEGSFSFKAPIKDTVTTNIAVKDTVTPPRRTRK